MGNDKAETKPEPKAKAKAKPADPKPIPPAQAEPMLNPPVPPMETKPKAKPKPPTVKELNGYRGGLESILDDLIALASTEPYLVDAQAFLTQAIACLGKQIVTEGGKVDGPPKA